MRKKEPEGLTFTTREAVTTGDSPPEVGMQFTSRDAVTTIVEAPAPEEAAPAALMLPGEPEHHDEQSGEE